MQNPQSVTIVENTAILEYGVIERTTSGAIFATITDASVKNFVNSSLGSTDPIISIPASVKNYKYADIRIKINFALLYACAAPPGNNLRYIECDAFSWNNVGPTSAYITIDNAPCLTQFVDKDETIKLSYVPSVINFSQFGVRAKFDYSLNNTATTAFALDVPASTHAILCTLRPIITLYGTN